MKKGAGGDYFLKKKIFWGRGIGNRRAGDEISGLCIIGSFYFSWWQFSPRNSLHPPSPAKLIPSMPWRERWPHHDFFPHAVRVIMSVLTFDDLLEWKGHSVSFKN